MQYISAYKRNFSHPYLKMRTFYGNSNTHELSMVVLSAVGGSEVTSPTRVVSEHRLSAKIFVMVVMMM